MSVRLRRARASDAYALWVWANDPVTRLGSSGRAPIPWSHHLGWLSSRLESTSALLFIAIADDERRVGAIRFETEDDWSRARLSYVVAPEVRGAGFARPLLTLGLESLAAHAPGVIVDAIVNLKNERSLRLFRSPGWSERASSDESVTFTTALRIARSGGAARCL